MFSRFCFWLFATRLVWVFRTENGVRVRYSVKGFFSRQGVWDWHTKIMETTDPKWELVRCPLSQLEIHGDGV